MEGHGKDNKQLGDNLSFEGSRTCLEFKPCLFCNSKDKASSSSFTNGKTKIVFACSVFDSLEKSVVFLVSLAVFKRLEFFMCGI